jgi:hypothetical protein
MSTPTVTVTFVVEGQVKGFPSMWDSLGFSRGTLEQARQVHQTYTGFLDGDCHWLAFRIVKVTTTREVMP